MRVAWTRAALADLDEIQNYVARDSPAAAHRLAIDLFDRTEQGLSANPLMGRVGRADGTRELVLSDVPYIVVYRRTDRVEILAIVHSAKRWPERFDQ